MIPGGVQVFVSVEPVDLRAGFERTEYPYLFRRVLSPLAPESVAAYTARAAAFGPF